MIPSLMALARPVARINGGGGGGGGVRDPPKVDLLDPKSGRFWTSPPYPPTKTPFLAHFVAKSGPFGRFGGCIAPTAPLATGLVLANYNLIPMTPLFNSYYLMTPFFGCFCCSTIQIFPHPATKLHKLVFVVSSFSFKFSLFGKSCTKWPLS